MKSSPSQQDVVAEARTTDFLVNETIENSCKWLMTDQSKQAVAKNVTQCQIKEYFSWPLKMKKVIQILNEPLDLNPGLHYQ